MKQPNIEIVEDVEEPDRLDQLLGILAYGDFVTPAVALARGGASLAVPRYEAAESAAILKAARICSWSWQVSGGYIVFDVDHKDARRACKLLGMQYRKPPSAWSGRVLLVLALGSGLMLVWFAFSILTIGGGLR